MASPRRIRLGLQSDQHILGGSLTRRPGEIERAGVGAAAGHQMISAGYDAYSPRYTSLRWPILITRTSSSRSRTW